MECLKEPIFAGVRLFEMSSEFPDLEALQNADLWVWLGVKGPNLKRLLPQSSHKHPPVIQIRPSNLKSPENVAEGLEKAFIILHGKHSDNWKTQLKLLASHCLNVDVEKSPLPARGIDPEYLQSLSGSGAEMTVVLNKEGVVRFASENIEGLLGYSPGELLGANVFEYIHAEDYKAIIEVFKKGKSSPKTPQYVNLRIRHKEGYWKNFRSRGQNLLKDPKVEGILVNSLDITAQIDAEHNLKKSEARYNFLSNVINDGIWEWDIYHDKLFWSGKLKELIGPSEDCAVNSWKDLKPLIHPSDRHPFEKALWNAVNETGILGIDIRIITQWGEYGYFNVKGGLIKDERGQPIYMAGFVSDVTLHKELLSKEKYVEYHDPLTRLPNRAKLMQQLKSSISRYKKDNGKCFSLVLLDLNRFKNINTIFGHKHGNQLLLSFANRLRRFVDKSDVLARVAGSEFALILRGKTAAEAGEFCRMVKSELSGPFSILGQHIYITLSSGIAESHPENKDAENMMRNASIAMTRAKQNGTHHSEIYSEGMHQDEIYFHELENDLQGALDKGEFFLEYQPIYSLAENQVEGFEALIRWNHPKYGTIYPLDFIWLAEQSNLIVPIGKWVLEEACSQLAVWENQFSTILKISVNLSPRQFSNKELFSSIEQVLREHPLRKNKLQFEITESVAMDDSEEHISILRKLNEMGIHVSIDDFGVGYSSLEMLKKFDLHTLKVDRSFIKDLASNKKSPALLNSIISMAKDLNLNIVAEGVETSDQLKFLQAAHCDSIQGYYLSRPLAANRIETFLNQNLEFVLQNAQT